MFVLFRNRVHLVFELSEILIVTIGLVVVLVNSNNMVLFSVCLFKLNFIYSFFVLVDLVREHLVSHLLLLENEVDLCLFRCKVFKYLHRYLGGIYRGHLLVEIVV